MARVQLARLNNWRRHPLIIRMLIEDTVSSVSKGTISEWQLTSGRDCTLVINTWRGDWSRFPVSHLRFRPAHWQEDWNVRHETQNGLGSCLVISVVDKILIQTVYTDQKSNSIYVWMTHNNKERVISMYLDTCCLTTGYLCFAGYLLLCVYVNIRHLVERPHNETYLCACFRLKVCNTSEH